MIGRSIHIIDNYREWAIIVIIDKDIDLSTISNIGKMWKKLTSDKQNWEMGKFVARWRLGATPSSGALCPPSKIFNFFFWIKKYKETTKKPI